jgi:hypothetical protein
MDNFDEKEKHFSKIEEELFNKVMNGVLSPRSEYGAVIDRLGYIVPTLLSQKKIEDRKSMLANMCIRNNVIGGTSKEIKAYLDNIEAGRFSHEDDRVPPESHEHADSNPLDLSNSMVSEPDPETAVDKQAQCTSAVHERDHAESEMTPQDSGEKFDTLVSDPDLGNTVDSQSQITQCNQGNESTKHARAFGLLKDMFIGMKSVAYQKIKQVAEKAGISPRDFTRARNKMGILSQENDGETIWYISEMKGE